MFLDKGGKKISKSAGNVVTAQKWFRYGTPKSMLLLLYKRITGARELGFEDIPVLMDEYNELEDIYFGRVKLDNEAKATKSKGLYEYTNLLNTPKTPSIHVNYRLLVELCRIFKENRASMVTKKLIDYGAIKNPDHYIEQLIELAGNYADDFGEEEPAQLQLTDITKKALRQLVAVLEAEKEPEDLQNIIYNISKENNVSPKEFFMVLYQIILAANRGPKIGPFILDIGRKKVAQTITRHL
jgi:lysyl-tRNA synthetase class 1